ncbi:MAG: hypothetical protein HY378_01595 [Candidatus Brennerbacteria bacterium]|nr:hypothetical protein [Candidatus Brennerbacteria bacterium]
MRRFFAGAGALLLALIALRMVGVVSGLVLVAALILLIIAHQLLVHRFPATRGIITLVFAGAVILAAAAAFLGPYTGFSSASFKRFLKDRDVRVAAKLMPPALGSRAEALNQIQEVDDIASGRDAQELEAAKAAYEAGRISADSAYRAIGQILGRAQGRAQLIRETTSRLKPTAHEPSAAATTAPAVTSRTIEVGDEEVKVLIPRRHEFDILPTEAPVLIRRTDGEVFERTPDGKLLYQGREVTKMGWPIPGYTLYLRSKSGDKIRVTFSSWPERS